MPQLAGASHVSFSITDLDASVAWFERVFGTEIFMHEPGAQRSAAVLTVPGTSLLIGLTKHAGSRVESFDPARTGLDHFAFAVESEASLGDWAAHLDALGIEHSGVIPVPPGAILNLKGPDGIALALLWRR